LKFEGIQWLGFKPTNGMDCQMGRIISRRKIMEGEDLTSKRNQGMGFKDPKSLGLCFSREWRLVSFKSRARIEFIQSTKIVLVLEG